jgi:hypothetical protein
MRRSSPRGNSGSVQMLEAKLSQSAFAPADLLLARGFMHVHVAGFDDPLPGPEPPPSYPGGEPPIEYPVLPPSGPAGPGS